VYFDWKYKGKISEEFYVLQEKSKNHQFARKGDSGASVVSHPGDIVGMVFARAVVHDINIIIDKGSRIPDLAVIADRCRSDGTMDIKGLTTAIFQGESLVLLQSIDMVLAHCTVKGDVVYDL